MIWYLNVDKVCVRHINKKAADYLILHILIIMSYLIQIQEVLV